MPLVKSIASTRNPLLPFKSQVAYDKKGKRRERKTCLNLE
jgi:hypothetical protein